MVMMCEDCGKKQASFGMADDRKKRWCGSCGKTKNAIYLINQKMCEDCGKKQVTE